MTELKRKNIERDTSPQKDAPKEGQPHAAATKEHSAKPYRAEHAPKTSAKASQKANRMETGRLKLLITVVNMGKADYFVDLIQSYDVNMQLVCLAKGTASAQMISLLGLEDRSRSVIFSIIREDKAQDIMDALDEKFRTIKNGKGVAYTVPLASMIGVAAYGFLSNDPRTLKEEKK